jgi:hypothetical protein
VTPDHVRLHPSSRVVEAEWLEARLRRFGTGVASVLPDGFPAYTRILHPARGINGEQIRWAEIAAKSGGAMHRLVQFHAINRSAVSNSDMAVGPPEGGNLPSNLVKHLCAALAKHTSTSDACWFCLWEGHGWLHDGSMSTIEFRPKVTFAQSPPTLAGAAGSARLSPALRAAVQNTARVQLSERNYLLFKGPLDAVTELGWTMAGGFFVPQSPNLFWPDDHAWCVASEIDLFCTLVGGSYALAESLLGDRDLEAWPVFAADPISADSDDENP